MTPIEALKWIATTNAMDYEYQECASAALVAHDSWHLTNAGKDFIVMEEKQEPSDAKDAARWRYWLKSHGWSGYFDDGASNEDSPSAVNSAIDAAMAKETP